MNTFYATVRIDKHTLLIQVSSPNYDYATVKVEDILAYFPCDTEMLAIGMAADQ